MGQWEAPVLLIKIFTQQFHAWFTELIYSSCLFWYMIILSFNISGSEESKIRSRPYRFIYEICICFVLMFFADFKISFQFYWKLQKMENFMTNREIWNFLFWIRILFNQILIYVIKWNYSTRNENILRKEFLKQGFFFIILFNYIQSS